MTAISTLQTELHQVRQAQKAMAERPHAVRCGEDDALADQEAALVDAIRHERAQERTRIVRETAAKNEAYRAARLADKHGTMYG